MGKRKAKNSKKMYTSFNPFNVKGYNGGGPCKTGKGDK